jgi:hypothetical protein
VRTCTIEGCGRAEKAKGLCGRHHKRMWKYGDPHFTKTKPRGVAQEFYENVVLTYEGEECLIWPFARTRNGYGTIKRNGRDGITSRFVCEDSHGPPPTLEHEAAHSCGNGRLGCVTKGHLSWKTRVENQADRLIHDTHIRGERSYTAKLTEAQAREILSLAGVESGGSIAKRYGVSRRAVYSIHKGLKWAWLAEPAKENRNASAA